MSDHMSADYFSKPKWTKTWSGLSLKESYSPEDTKNFDYQNNIANPGEYPYTRGIHPNMHRGRLWTRREVSGHTSPEESNIRLKYLIEHGETGLNVIPDLPYQLAIDSDHPFAKGDIGAQGVPCVTLRDMEILMDGIDQRNVSITFSTIFPFMFTQYIALAEKRAVDISGLRGTILMDTLHSFCVGQLPFNPPLDLGFKLSIDTIEYAISHMPRWYPLCLDSYDLRETGISAAQEIAFAFSMAFSYIDGALQRGLNIDDIASMISFTVSAHIDFFEEIAKLRAARRLWARSMKERYSAKNPRSWKMKFHTNTAGCVQVRQQPLNNIVRIAYQAMAAVLGGTQSLHCVSFDEPICLPTEESHRIALRTQEILAYETGVANVADPLGGSYYIESITHKLEEEMESIIKKIDELGGSIETISNGWMESEMAKAALKYQKEVETGQRIIVGRNAFMEEEEGIKGHKIPVQKILPQAVRKHIRNLKEVRRIRRKDTLKKALENLRKTAEHRSENLIPALIEADKTYATVGEIMGTLREAYGYTYDPFEMVKNPFN